MKRFEHILATTDLAPESWSAVQYAAHLAKLDGSELTVLHVPHSVALVYSHWMPAASMIEIDREIEEGAREELESWVAKHLRDPAAKTLVRSGPTAETICRVAEELGVNLVVMATHGRAGVKHALLGSITEAVVRSAPCPVLTVNPTRIREAKKDGD